MNGSEHCSLFTAQHFHFITFALDVEPLTGYKRQSYFCVQWETAHFCLSLLYLLTCLKGIFKESIPILDLWKANKQKIMVQVHGPIWQHCLPLEKPLPQAISGLYYYIFERGVQVTRFS